MIADKVLNGYMIRREDEFETLDTAMMLFSFEEEEINQIGISNSIVLYKDWDDDNYVRVITMSETLRRSFWYLIDMEETYKAHKGSYKISRMALEILILKWYYTNAAENRRRPRKNISR